MVKTTSNDLIILKRIISDQKESIAPDVSNEDFFEIFCPLQILKNYDLSYDEVQASIVDGGNDGGIDAFLVLCNNEIILEEDHQVKSKGPIAIEVHIFQSKFSESFSGTAVDSLIQTAGDIFDLSKSGSDLSSTYNEKVIAKAKIFKELYTKTASQFPSIKFHFHYCSLGSDVHANVERKVSRLEKEVRQLFRDAVFAFNFYKSRDLVDKAKQSPKKNL